jgi:hypothetical protein
MIGTLHIELFLFDVLNAKPNPTYSVSLYYLITNWRDAGANLNHLRLLLVKGKAVE